MSKSHPVKVGDKWIVITCVSPENWGAASNAEGKPFTFDDEQQASDFIRELETL